MGERVGSGDGVSHYQDFLTALCAWQSCQGGNALAMSFYGRQDGVTAREPSPDYPLFGALHYLIRSHGCARVIETGTARGVSAACLASAVMGREDAHVVTLDIAVHPARASLWAALPAPMRDVIEPWGIDSLTYMQQDVNAGAWYHAALLDSSHDGAHVYNEFQLARRLVRPGGPILIHDAIFPSGTVGEALARIRADGYDVVELWTAESGEREDDGLGLAVIVNRGRSC